MRQLYSGTRRRIVAVLVGLVTVAGLTLIVATPAQARPVCRYAASVRSAPASTDIATRLVPAASTSTTADPDCDMGYGALSAAVEGLQQAINYCYTGGVVGSANIASLMRGYGYPNFQGLSQDGQFGQMTRAAVKSVQTIEGVAVDGVFGPNTRNSMRWFFSRDETGCTRLDVNPVRRCSRGRSRSQPESALHPALVVMPAAPRSRRPSGHTCGHSACRHATSRPTLVLWLRCTAA